MDKIHNDLANLEKILGSTNIYKKSQSEQYTHMNYSIKTNTMEFYGDTIDEKIIGIIIENDISKIIIHKQLLHSIDNLPNNVIILVLYRCNSSQLYDLPNSITHLYFVDLIGELNCLPSGIKLIDFGNNFDSKINILPISMEEIILGNKFNQMVNNLPPNLKSIKFGEKFNQMVDNLPSQLEIIIFGSSFNQSIDNLPNSIKYIEFNWVGIFSLPIHNLPNSLEEIKFNNSFCNEVCELPNGLKKILLGTNFSKPINAPYSLEKIKLCSKYKYLNLIRNMFSENTIKELYF